MGANPAQLQELAAAQQKLDAMRRTLGVGGGAQQNPMQGLMMQTVQQKLMSGMTKKLPPGKQAMVQQLLDMVAKPGLQPAELMGAAEPLLGGLDAETQAMVRMLMAAPQSATPTTASAPSLAPATAGAHGPNPFTAAAAAPGPAIYAALAPEHVAAIAEATARATAAEATVVTLQAAYSDVLAIVQTLAKAVEGMHSQHEKTAVILDGINVKVTAQTDVIATLQHTLGNTEQKLNGLQDEVAELTETVTAPADEPQPNTITNGHA